MSESDMDTEKIKAFHDRMLYGQSFMLDGKRVDPAAITVADPLFPSCPTCDGTGELPSIYDDGEPVRCPECQ